MAAPVSARIAPESKLSFNRWLISARRGPHPYMYRLHLRVEHVQSAYSSDLPEQSFVVQPAIYDIHRGACAARIKCCVRRTLG